MMTMIGAVAVASGAVALAVAVLVAAAAVEALVEAGRQAHGKTRALTLISRG